MTKNKVMKLWTAIVTAFLALCTALGLVSAGATTAVAAGPRTESPRTGTAQRTAPTTPAAHHWAWSHARALPPTMKQRIRAEAHGKSPSCRHRTLPQTQSEAQIPEQTSEELDC
ncbi:DUF6344 domain-containing protein [Streptomyces sp. NRRL S-31]|uniref:DUF6344 domain-containing protein n=1 Tax=Streptomyces sp. NRRL S-31 TaxID=1463898 RepID=UPI0004C7284F|nr:DUF6344 domain-containing protein [Streptomyces sp. NRRL S-31]